MKKYDSALRETNSQSVLQLKVSIFLLHVLTQANEKYKVDALMQKIYTVDFLTKKKAIIKVSYRSTT